MAKKRAAKVDRKQVLFRLRQLALHKLLAALTSPSLLIFFGILLIYYQRDLLSAGIGEAWPILSYGTLCFGMTITAVFSRSRSFFLLVVLTIAEWAMNMQAAYPLVSFLVPLNFAFFSVAAERGVLSSRGRKYILLLLLELFFGAEVLLSNDREFAGAIGGKTIAAFAGTPLSDLALITFFVAFLLLFFQRRQASLYFNAAFFGALALVVCGQHFFQNAQAVPLFYTGAALSIIVAVIQDYYYKAYMDELTGLPARRSLNETLQKLEGVYTIAMVDVDFFKKFNDTYGHDAGDDVLRLIASVMKNCSKARFFRYGGEEFTVLFPGKTLEEALPILEEVRESIAKRSFVVSTGKNKRKGTGKKLNVTVSMGVAQAKNNKEKVETVLKAADTALYRAKEAGRNCVRE
ncbi:MAG: GGDEF domain-containing protein [Sporomusaceae bacterium]|nr:GGDEF domain-containing protein [Sporomusaceae bacterium]